MLGLLVLALLVLEVFSVKMIDQDAEVSAKKAIIALIFKIDGGGIHMVIFWINQDTTVLFQIVVLVSKIRYLGAITFSLVSYLADVIIKEQYPLILYRKYLEYI